MNQLCKLTALASLCMLGASPLQADQTNLVQTIDFRLAGLVQGANRTNGTVVNQTITMTTLATREVITALGTATGNTFTRAAQLVMVTPLQSDLVTSFQVRDGSTTVDVSGFFNYQQTGSTIVSTESNARSGTSTVTDYSFQQLALQDKTGYPSLSVHFSLSGIATLNTQTTKRGWNSTVDINGSGTGDRNGQAVLFQGAIDVSGNTLEVVSSGNSPGV